MCERIRREYARPERVHTQSTPSELLTKLLNTLRREYAPSRENAHAQGPCVISAKSTVYDKDVLILLYVSSCCCICSHTAIHVCSYCYICVLILLHLCSYCYICVLILLYTAIYMSSCCVMRGREQTVRQIRPYTTKCVRILLYVCPHTAIYVSSYCYSCVLILLHMCLHLLCTAVCVLILCAAGEKHGQRQLRFSE
jgi:hypothetical protein